MAIKRPSRTRGTPSRKTATTAALRHVEVLSRLQMVPGTAYTGWVCKSPSCGLVIAIVPSTSGSKASVHEAEDPLTALQCPHCGNEDLYRWSARAEHSYAPKP